MTKYKTIIVDEFHYNLLARQADKSKRSISNQAELDIELGEKV